MRLLKTNCGNTFKIGRYDDIITKNNKITVWNFTQMDWLKSTSGKVVAVLAPIVIALPIALAEEAKYVGEDYYGNDINAAVLEASQNKRQINHTHKNWYNRTTSRSFGLPQMGSEDMEAERLEGALGATASGAEINQANPELPAEDQSEQVQKDIERNNQPNTPQTPTFVNNVDINTSVPSGLSIRHFPRGDTVSTHGILSNGTVTSTPRP